MTPEKSREAQVEMYRQMTGEQCLLVGLRLHELACDVARDSIRALFPQASVSEVEEKLKARLRLAYASHFSQGGI